MATLEQGLVLGVVLVTLVLFWTEWLRAELTALFAMVLLMVLGLVTPQQGVSGFSNSATITVLALFVVSAGVYRSGIITWLGRKLGDVVGKSPTRAILVIVVLAGPASMFLNNTAVVAILIPLVLALAVQGRMSPSKLLMPLSQIAMLAGTVTLVGTSTNVLASSLVRERTGEGFGVFEFADVGLWAFGVGALYILLIGRHLIPERIRPGDSGEELLLQEFVTEVRVLDGSPLLGKPITEHPAFRPGKLEVLRILRDGQALTTNVIQPVQAGDIIAIQATRATLAGLEKEAGVAFLSGVKPEDIEGGPVNLAEVIVAPNSTLVRRTLTEGWIARNFNVRILGMRTSRRLPAGFVFTTRLNYGDTLLVLASNDAIERLRGDPDFIVASEYKREDPHKRQAFTSIAIVAAVVGLAVSGVLDIMVSALAGAVAMVLARVLQAEDLWTSVRWDVIFLMAGLIPLGIALEATGLADVAGDLVASTAAGLPDVGIIALFYVASMLLTAVLSNNGNVVLLVPIAFSTAAALAVDPIPLVIAVMMAASNDFLTPIGYQTNLMVYGPGGYKFSDYARVGAPLAIILSVVTSVAIAHSFPLR